MTKITGVGIETASSDYGIQWYLDGVPHREDGPAFTCVDGYTKWYHHGSVHRIDGPAVYWPLAIIKSPGWFLHGRAYTFDEWCIANTEIDRDALLLLKMQHG